MLRVNQIATVFDENWVRGLHFGEDRLSKYYNIRDVDTIAGFLPEAFNDSGGDDQ